MSQVVKIKDKEFVSFISSDRIQNRIKELASEINKDLEGRSPVFISVLTGAFMFTADLLKHITIPSEVSFIRVSSYHGTASTGTVLQVLGLKEEIKDRTVVVLEDIVDTGNTMISLMNILKSHQPAEVKVATLLFKPAALKYKVNLDYVGFEVPNDFLVGYGLDYDGLGRNLNDICTLVIEK